jgi:hypothetical protein
MNYMKVRLELRQKRIYIVYPTSNITKAINLVNTLINVWIGGTCCLHTKKCISCSGIGLQCLEWGGSSYGNDVLYSWSTPATGISNYVTHAFTLQHKAHLPARQSMWSGPWHRLTRSPVYAASYRQCAGALAPIGQWQLCITLILRTLSIVSSFV